MATLASKFIGNNERERVIAQRLNDFFDRAAADGIADIHLESVESGALELRVRNRDGLMVREWVFEDVEAPLVLNKIRQRADLSTLDTRAPQDSRITQIALGRRLDVRVSIVPTLHGASCVMRILDSKNAGMPLDALKMPPRVRRAFLRAIDLPEGVILTVGPTGSGKTSTLYSALNILNTPDRKIVTVEDPVEYVLPGVQQVQAGHGTGTTFAQVLRAFLRQDPDVILVGEVRDAETATVALQAGQTGHLVLSTLHANSAIEAFTRLSEMGVSAHAMRSSLRAIIAQRLLRKVCPHCSKPTDIVDQDALAFIQQHGLQITQQMQGAGCDACNQTGYSGRQAIYEMLLVDGKLRHALSTNDPAALAAVAKAQGQYEPLTHAAARLVAEGVTNFKEALRVSSDL